MKRLTASILVLSLIGLVTHAQQRGLGVSRPPVKAQERRFALVIGNGAYTDSPLLNPVNDARDMAQALGQLGFDVMHKENLTQNEMKKTIKAFGERIRESGIGLFYYAGHGIQVNGQNYLIPVGANISNEAEVEYESVDAGLVFAQMDTARNKMNIVILDACRNNPFARSFRSSVRGLAQITAPSGTLIAYATAPGSVASDGSARNGLYTQELLRYIRMPGLSIEEVFKRVRIAVRDRTQAKQVPWEASSLVGDFYFTPPNGSALVPSPQGSRINQIDAEPAKPAVKRDPTDPVSGKWELTSLGYRTKTGQFLRATPPAVSILRLQLTGSHVSGTETDPTGTDNPIKDGRWSGNQLEMTTEDSNLRFPWKIRVRLEGNKLVGEAVPVVPNDKKRYMIPYLGQQYDLRDLALVLEAVRKE